MGACIDTRFGCEEIGFEADSVAERGVVDIAAFPIPAGLLAPTASASGISVSAGFDAAMLALLWRRARRGATGRVDVGARGAEDWAGAGLGGPGAMAITCLTGLSLFVEAVGVLVPAPPEPGVSGSALPDLATALVDA